MSSKQSNLNLKSAPGMINHILKKYLDLKTAKS